MTTENAQTRVADELPHCRLPSTAAEQVVKLSEILWSNPGAARRELMLTYLSKTDQGIPINRKWQLSDADPDIKKLIHKGLVIRKRVMLSRRTGQTYLYARLPPP